MRYAGGGGGLSPGTALQQRAGWLGRQCGIPICSCPCPPRSPGTEVLCIGYPQTLSCGPPPDLLSTSHLPLVFAEGASLVRAPGGMSKGLGAVGSHWALHTWDGGLALGALQEGALPRRSPPQKAACVWAAARGGSHGDLWPASLGRLLPSLSPRLWGAENKGARSSSQTPSQLSPSRPRCCAKCWTCFCLP